MGVVEIQDKDKKKRIHYELGVDIDFAPGKVMEIWPMTFVFTLNYCTALRKIAVWPHQSRHFHSTACAR